MDEFNGDSSGHSVVNGWAKSGSTRSNGLNGTEGGSVETTGTASNGPNLNRLEDNDRVIPELSSAEKSSSSNGSASIPKDVVSTNGGTKTVPSASACTQSDEDSEDDYCVYTYKGGSREIQQLADLPSSFYQFDSSDNQSDDLASHSGELGGCLNAGNFRDQLRFSDGSRRLHNASGSFANVPNGLANPAPNVFSPDMDFLEMDFDPSGYTDPDGNDYISPDDDEVPNLVTENRDIDRKVTPDAKRLENSHPQSAVHEVPSTSTCCRSTPAASSVLTNLNSHAVEPGGSSSTRTPIEIRKSDVNNCDSMRTLQLDQIGSSNLPLVGNTVTASMTSGDNVVTLSQRENHLSLRLVKSNTLPQLANKPSDALISDGNSFRSSERSSTLFSSEPVFHDSSDKHCSYRARIDASEETTEDSVELKVGRIMIWDDAQAKEMAVNQIGTSACGATALLNVLRALKMDASPDFVNACVGTRLRAEAADLPQYLFSRSNAGATHLDLISGIRRASNNLVFARFFQIKKNISFSAFNKWILNWICKGAIPVVTRNLQVGSFASPQDVPDSWHHQMVFGVSPEGLYLINPIECVPEATLLPQVTSDSVLLVRRHDIISRKGPTTDLRQLARHTDPRWNEINVLGQVANILLEEIPYFSENTAARRVRSSHIKIPAQYKAGVTLFILRTSPACHHLENASEPS
ncbi:unnamed protein product [Allacma fusca]|uniref:Uncharacterized protein n=1 Tax=Allacma fusca TaxID=39272 RepID=A0A8J2PRE7_9HEXA|nr:unnamed protein product [Allacma fusca]